MSLNENRFVFYKINTVGEKLYYGETNDGYVWDRFVNKNTVRYKRGRFLEKDNFLTREFLDRFALVDGWGLEPVHGVQDKEPPSECILIKVLDHKERFVGFAHRHYTLVDSAFEATNFADADEAREFMEQLDKTDIGEDRILRLMRL